MPHHAFGITYNGAAFHGWQRQPDVDTVQGVLEHALSRVADHPIHIHAAGRTDAGVHATGQVASFTSDAPRQLRDWQRGLNALTPDNIQVDWVTEIEPAFHPRYSATARRYIYIFHDIGKNHPLMLKRVWGCAPLDADAMHRAAQALVGEHDFTTFRGAACQSLTPMRKVHRCDVYRRGSFVVMEIEANAFVLHMVRNIARGLHDIGMQATGLSTLPKPVLSIAELLLLRDRNRLGATAPPYGLYLTQVSYPDFDLPVPAGVPFLSLPA